MDRQGINGVLPGTCAVSCSAVLSAWAGLVSVRFTGYGFQDVRSLFCVLGLLGQGVKYELERFTMKVSLEQVMAVIENGEYAGFCLACGAQADGVEPDARKYECSECGAHKVYGAEEILLMCA